MSEQKPSALVSASQRAAGKRPGWWETDSLTARPRGERVGRPEWDDKTVAEFLRLDTLRPGQVTFGQQEYDPAADNLAAAFERIARGPAGAGFANGCLVVGLVLKVLAHDRSERIREADRLRARLRWFKGFNAAVLRGINRNVAAGDPSDSRRREYLLIELGAYGLACEMADICRQGVRECEAEVRAVDHMIADTAVGCALLYRASFAGRRVDRYGEVALLLFRGRQHPSVPTRKLKKLVSEALRDLAQPGGYLRWPFAARLSVLSAPVKGDRVSIPSASGLKESPTQPR